MKRLLKILLLCLIFLEIRKVDASFLYNISIENPFNRSVNLKLYKIDENINNITDKEKLNNIILELKESYDEKEEKDLKEILLKIDVSILSNSQKSLSLENGIYYFREMSDNPKISGVFMTTSDYHKISLKENYIPNDRELKIIKYKDDKREENKISGVEFKLYKKRIDSSNLDLIEHIEQKYVRKNGNSILITDKNGEIVLKSLPIGEYILKEIKTIDGYKIADEIYIDLLNNKNQEIDVINIKNKSTDNGILSKTGLSSDVILMLFITIIAMGTLFILIKNEKEK